MTTEEPEREAPRSRDICDSHFHVFGPYRQFALPASPTYRPVEAPAASYLALADALRFRRMVVVQGGCYGTDNAAMLDAIAVFGRHRARGVALIDDSFSAQDLARLHEQGVRGIRINAISDASVDAAVLMKRATAIANLGWHMKIHARPDQIVDLADVLARLPVEVVIDHCARLDPKLGGDQAVVASILRLLQRGNTWVKLTFYRSSTAGSPWDDLKPIVQKFAVEAPDRCIWGSDWPHPLMSELPNTAELLRVTEDWLDELGLRKKILWENPSKLYGFEI